MHFDLWKILCYVGEKKHLTVVFDETKVISESNRMKLNKEKIKVMFYNDLDRKRLNTNIDREPVIQVKNYCYVCNEITEEDWSELNIISSIAEEKRVFQIRNHLLTANSIRDLNAKKMFFFFKYVYVWSVTLYVCETCTISAIENKKLKALEIWRCGKTLEIFLARQSKKWTGVKES